MGTALATEVWQLFLAYAIGSVGVGIVYTVAVNTAIKWFPDRPGLTTGIGTMAFGGGAAIFVPVVRAAETPEQLSTFLFWLGVLIGVGILLGAVVLRDPPTGWRRTSDAAAEIDIERPRQYHWRTMLGTWQFWLLYAMFVSVSAAGLMITARIVLFTEHLGFIALVATAAATILPIASGGGRLVMGWVSDRMQREFVMALSFLSCGGATLLLVGFGSLEAPIWYLFAVVVAVFFWSSQFSLFPSLVAEYYGTSMSSSNYALVYSGKLWGGVFGGVIVGWLVTVVGWDSTFIIGGALALMAGIGAFFLRPPTAR